MRIYSLGNQLDLAYSGQSDPVADAIAAAVGTLDRSHRVVVQPHQQFIAAFSEPLSCFRRTDTAEEWTLSRFAAERKMDYRADEVALDDPGRAARSAAELRWDARVVAIDSNLADRYDSATCNAWLARFDRDDGWRRRAQVRNPDRLRVDGQRARCAHDQPQDAHPCDAEQMPASSFSRRHGYSASP